VSEFFDWFSGESQQRYVVEDSAKIEDLKVKNGSASLANSL
jgi:hypothetical protein